MTKEITGEEVSPSETDPEHAGRPLRQQRIVWILAMLALFGAGIGFAFVLDGERFYRLDFLQPWSSLVCWTVAWALLVGFAPRLAYNRTLLWMTLATLLGILTFPAWLITLLLPTGAYDNHTRIAAVHPSPDGRVHAVTETFYNMIDPSCRVWLREPDGLFARQILIWQEVESGCPRVSFPDNTTISLDFRNGEPLQTTTFDPDRMQVAETFLSYR